MSRIKPTIVLLLLSGVLIAQERETDFGAIVSVELKKRLWRKVDVSVDEEFRYLFNNSGLDRFSSTVGADYILLKKRLKAGVYYSHLYMTNSDHIYENRHRYYFSLLYKESLGLFTLSWRGRVQGTYRDENRGNYKINPKYVLRNKFEVDYTIRGSRFKPYFFTEITNTLNDPLGNEIDKLRFQGGVSCRLDKKTYLDLYLRRNESLIMPEPRTMYLGIGYKRDL